jgi:hypothetical protein
MTPGPVFNWFCVLQSVADILSRAARIRALQLSANPTLSAVSRKRKRDAVERGKPTRGFEDNRSSPSEPNARCDIGTGADTISDLAEDSTAWVVPDDLESAALPGNPTQQVARASVIDPSTSKPEAHAESFHDTTVFVEQGNISRNPLVVRVIASNMLSTSAFSLVFACGTRFVDSITMICEYSNASEATLPNSAYSHLYPS